MVSRRNMFDAAISLIISFFGVAGLYALLEAPPLAGVQLAVTVLIILAVRRTRELLSRQQSRITHQWWAAVIVAVLLGAVLGWVILDYDWGGSVEPAAINSIALLGTALVDPAEFALVLGLAAITLFIALVGAVVMVRGR